MEKDIADAIKVSVLQVNSPSDFVVRLRAGAVHNPDVDAFKKMSAEINTLYENSDIHKIQVPKPAIGGVYVGFCHVDHHWYRIKVESTVDRKAGIYVRCRLVDYGEEKLIPLRHVKLLDKMYRDVPFQVKTFCLSDVRPLSLRQSPVDLSLTYKSSIEWDTSAGEYMYRLTSEKSCLAKILHKDKTNAYHVRLFLKVEDEWKCFNDILVLEKYAESYIERPPSAPPTDEESPPQPPTTRKTIIGIMAEKRLKKGGAVLETPHTDVDLKTQTLLNMGVMKSLPNSDAESTSPKNPSDAEKAASTSPKNPCDAEKAESTSPKNPSDAEKGNSSDRAKKPRGRAALILKALESDDSRPGSPVYHSSTRAAKSGSDSDVSSGKNRNKISNIVKHNVNDLISPKSRGLESADPVSSAPNSDEMPLLVNGQFSDDSGSETKVKPVSARMQSLLDVLAKCDTERAVNGHAETKTALQPSAVNLSSKNESQPNSINQNTMNLPNIDSLSLQNPAPNNTQAKSSLLSDFHSQSLKKPTSKTPQSSDSDTRSPKNSITKNNSRLYSNNPLSPNRLISQNQIPKYDQFADADLPSMHSSKINTQSSYNNTHLPSARTPLSSLTQPPQKHISSMTRQPPSPVDYGVKSPQRAVYNPPATKPLYGDGISQKNQDMYRPSLVYHKGSI